VNLYDIQLNVIGLESTFLDLTFNYLNYLRIYKQYKK